MIEDDHLLIPSSWCTGRIEYKTPAAGLERVELCLLFLECRLCWNHSLHFPRDIVGLHLRGIVTVTSSCLSGISLVGLGIGCGPGPLGLVMGGLLGHGEKERCSEERRVSCRLLWLLS